MKRNGRVTPSPISPAILSLAPAAGVADHAQHGLQTAFSEIDRLSHSVKSAGNPISLDLKTRYVVNGLKKEQTISSIVNIYTNSTSKIEVEDKWDGNLPESSITNASAAQLASLWWVHYAEAWGSGGGAGRGRRACGRCVEPVIRKRADTDFDRRSGG